MDGGAGIATVLHRFSVTDYHLMAETGVFDHARVELIGGAIIDMAPIGTQHVLTVMQLTELLAPLLVSRRARISVQNSLRLGPQSEPEPDVVLLSWQAARDAHPSAPDVMLVIEVADTTLGYDRSTKAPLYAAAGIPEYWIVNLPERAIEVHREAGPDGYRQVARAVAGQVAPLTMPDFSIAVADILPPVAV